MRYAIKVSGTVFFEPDVKSGILRSYNEPLNGYDGKVLLSLNYYTGLTHPTDQKRMKEALKQLVASREKQATCIINALSIFIGTKYTRKNTFYRIKIFNKVKKGSIFTLIYI